VILAKWLSQFLGTHGFQRVDRTRQFVENFIDDVDFDTLICTGKSTQMVTDLPFYKFCYSTTWTMNISYTEYECVL
jgi:hypothetical protein